MDMPGDHHVVRQDVLVPDDRVVSEVEVDHHQIVGPDLGQPAAFCGAGVDGGALAENVLVADLEKGGFAGEFFVLRVGADDGLRVEKVAAADGGLAQDGDVGDESVAGPDHDIRPDDAERADLDVRSDLGFGVDGGHGVKRGHSIAALEIRLSQR